MDRDYEQMKSLFDKRDGNNVDYDAKKQEYFNEEYRDTGIYNEYDVKGHALKDHEEIAKKYNLVNFDDHVSFEVKEKEISKEKFARIKNIVYTIVGAVAIGSIMVIAADIIMHPECYLTTHPDFIGTGGIGGTFSRMYEELSNLIGGMRR